MKSKKIIAVTLIVVEIGLCAAIIFLGWAAYQQVRTSGIHIRLLQIDRASAEKDQQWSFPVSGAQKVVVRSAAGNIKIGGGAGNTLTVLAHKKAWDVNQAQAEKALDEMKVSVVQKDDVITVTYEMQTNVLVIGNGVQGTVDFTLNVPTQTTVRAYASQGSVLLSGTQGEATLQSAFGAVEVDQVTGTLHISSDSGALIARHIRGDETSSCTVTGQFGHIDLEDVTSNALKVQTASGRIDLADIAVAGGVKLTSRFGPIQVDRGSAGKLTISSDNGVVHLSQLSVSGGVDVSSQFGKLTLDGVKAASYKLDSNNGAILVAGAAGTIQVNSQSGGIKITGAENADLDLSTQDGSLEFEGTLGKGPHILKTESGNIRLSIPQDSSLNIDLQTETGRIKSELPVTLKDSTEENHWRGTIRDGGASLKAATNNGNITLAILAR